MTLFKWEVWSPIDMEDDPRWGEMQRKEGHPSTWKLFAQMTESGIIALVGTIEKPLDEERYYLGHAPPSDTELAAETLAIENGLGLCYHNTLQWRADHTPCESYDSLDKAKRVLALLVRRQEAVLLEQAQDRLRYVLQAMDALEESLPRT